jgi:hypothetical protein
MNERYLLRLPGDVLLSGTLGRKGVIAVVGHHGHDP